MANQPVNRGHKSPVSSPQSTTCSPSEPTMRRWPHPVDCADAASTPTGETDSVLRYLRCAVSYQNQLLAEIKTLLESFVVQQNSLPEEK